MENNTCLAFFLCLLLSLNSCSDKVYFLAGPTFDSGNVGLTNAGARDWDSRWGTSYEIGYAFSEKNFLSYNLSYIGYENYDGTNTYTSALEYARESNFSNFSLIYGGGFGFSHSFPSGPTIPLRIGLFYDIPVHENLSVRLGIMDRPQYFIKRGGQFNNGLSLMAGLRF